MGKKLYGGQKGQVPRPVRPTAGWGSWEKAANPSPPAMGSGEIPAGSEAEPQQKLNLVHFIQKKSGIW